MKTGSLSEYAKHRGVAPAYVTKLKGQGRLVMIQKDGKAVVNFDMSDRLIDNTADQARARNGQNAKPTPPAAIPAAEASAAPEGAATQSGGPGGGTGADGVFRRAQAQEKIFLAKTAELSYRKAIGEVIDKKAVERTVFDAFRSLRDQAFQAPLRAAGRVVSLTDAREIERVIADELRKAFDTWEEKMSDRLAQKGQA